MYSKGPLEWCDTFSYGCTVAERHIRSVLTYCVNPCDSFNCYDMITILL